MFMVTVRPEEGSSVERDSKHLQASVTLDRILFGNRQDDHCSRVGGLSKMRRAGGPTAAFSLGCLLAGMQRYNRLDSNERLNNFIMTFGRLSLQFVIGFVCAHLAVAGDQVQ